MRIQMIMQDDPLNHRSFKMDIGGFETVGDLCREIDAPCAERQCVGGLASAYCPAELNEKLKEGAIYRFFQWGVDAFSGLLSSARHVQPCLW